MLRFARFLAVMIIFSAAVSAEQAPVRIATFPQEIGHRFTEADGLPAEEVARVAVGSKGEIYAATANGLAHFVPLEAKHWTAPRGQWKLVPGTKGRSWRALGAAGDQVFAADEAGIFRVNEKGVEAFASGTAGVSDLAGDAESVFAATDGGFLVFSRDGKLQKKVDDLKTSQVTASGVTAGESGVFARGADATLEKLLPGDGAGTLWAQQDALGVASGPEGELWICTKAGLVRHLPEQSWELLTGEDGLPYNDFTCAAAGPNGEVWLGTRRGAIRHDGTRWAYRQGKAWLPSDVVNDIAVDAQGGAWFATPEGIGYIERRPMTLAEKAEVYEEEIEKYIKRTPFGYTSEVELKIPGDRGSGVIYSDSDNDGLWTSMYGAGECYAYAATRSPKAKERAKEAFEALRFLQKVTQGGEHAPPHGYVARTIRTTEDADPNVGRIEGDRKEQAESDTMWKVYEPRWPKSADGKWYWKSDTSSDELDGHYFFYPLYHDLVAEDEAEKERVREVVRDLTDHLMKHGFALMDHDGTVTRWAVYGPEQMNQNPLWWVERGINSLSILSYLATAEHVTGDEKYGKAARELIEKHGYLQNLTFPKMQWGHGTGNQSDDEMAVMSFYNLIRYTKDDAVRDIARFAFYRYWTLEFPELNPFFNFAYASVGIGKTVTDQWGTWPLDPSEGWLTDSMDTLTGFPLDRCNWARKNSHRLDIVFYPFGNSREPYAPDESKRGYLRNGKCLPVAERYFHHWNTDPWHLDYGGNGASLASGTVFLLPYYMGLYHGFIDEG